MAINTLVALHGANTPFISEAIIPSIRATRVALAAIAIQAEELGLEPDLFEHDFKALAAESEATALGIIEHPHAGVVFKGAVSGAASTVAGHAFDVKGMNQQAGQSVSWLQAFKKPGLVTSMGIATARNGSSSLVAVYVNNFFVNHKIPGSGVASGTVMAIYDTIVWMPLANARQRVLTNKSPNFVQAFKDLQAKDGVAGLYKGTLAPTLARNIAFYAVFCGALTASFNEKDSIGVSAAKGGVMSALATSASFPFERIRFENTQTNDKLSMAKTVQMIWKKQGPKGFTVGLLVALARNGVVGAILSFGVQAALKTAENTIAEESA